MNKQRFLFLIVVVQSWLNRSQNIVRLEAYDIMKEASELVNLRFDFNYRSSVLIDKANMILDFSLEIHGLVRHLVNEVLLLQDLQKLFGII